MSQLLQLHLKSTQQRTNLVSQLLELPILLRYSAHEISRDEYADQLKNYSKFKVHYSNPAFLLALIACAIF
jgi:hypothetical protein